MNINDIYVSACRGAFDRNTTMVRLVDWLENVRPEPPRNDWEKKQLPAIMPHGLFATRRQDSFTKHSGLVQIDIDAKHNRGMDVDNMLREIQSDPCVLVSGKSCSGSGFYFLVVAAGINNENHSFVATEIVEYYEAQYMIDCDTPVSKNLSSLRFASPYAPFINYDVEPLAIEV
tara:strand:+ start:163 stop:684 length:522 start_codon:yes stop_codon:yes gene_type:complete